MANKPPHDPIEHFGRRPDDHSIWRNGPIWMASDRRLARAVGRPIAGFLKVEAAGGIVLLIAAVAALVLANSPWSDAYQSFLHTEVDLTVAGLHLDGDVAYWVNDALMVFFFFVVGLEIKYEIVSGELRDPRRAAVPILAAFGGMIVPALIYTAFNAGSDGASGWGIPMATDIAFAVGVLGLLGRRIPSPARVFLLTLAIVDDIGAIAVIAVFYTSDLSMEWLAAAGVGVLAMVALRRVRVWSMSAYALIGVFVWLATYESGVHATIAGVVIGLLTPARPLLERDVAQNYAREAMQDGVIDADELNRYRFLLGESVSVAERLERRLHPWTSYVVLPIFAFCNAGIDLRGGVLADALTSTVTAGVAVGLVAGKIIGVSTASWLAVVTGIGRLPDRTSWGMLVGLAAVAGIGFTVSLFIAGLSFEEGSVAESAAKVGILGASLVAAILGSTLLILTTRHREPAREDAPVRDAAGS
ncbi:MAG TPA: Na+/H+ antiporter NhaA [Nocardioidaceae bacterium]|nr:Na+/H+ antiporter NhaA [Nocardioidaceae bacterium]